MMVLLFLIIGLLIGGTVVCFFMAALQLHRVNKYEYQITELKSQLNKERFEKGEMIRAEQERLYEYNLPAYLQKDLDAYKEGLKNNSNLLDCLWGELYGSINIAQINDQFITPEHADYLRRKFLWKGEIDDDGTGIQILDSQDP